MLKKEKRKRRLLKEAKRLQKEADEKVGLLRDIQRIESEYELQIRQKVRELQAQINKEQAQEEMTHVIPSEDEESD